MARIGLHNLRHSYTGGGQRDEDWALKEMDVEWDDPRLAFSPSTGDGGRHVYLEHEAELYGDFDLH